MPGVSRSWMARNLLPLRFSPFLFLLAILSPYAFLPQHPAVKPDIQAFEISSKRPIREQNRVDVYEGYVKGDTSATDVPTVGKFNSDPTGTTYTIDPISNPLMSAHTLTSTAQTKVPILDEVIEEPEPCFVDHPQEATSCSPREGTYAPATILSNADLQVRKMAYPTTFIPGETVTYTIQVTNLGPSEARNLVVVDTLPDDITNPRFRRLSGGSWSPWEGQNNFGTLAANASLTLLIRGNLNADTKLSAVTNTAQAYSDAFDKITNNNSYSVNSPISPFVDLNLQLHADPQPPHTVVAGEMITFTADIRNNGPSYAWDVQLRDPLPDVIEDASYSVNGVDFLPWPKNDTLAVGDIPNNGEVRLFVRAKVASNTQPGSYTNMAEVLSGSQIINPASASQVVDFQVTVFADVWVEMEAFPEPVIAGNTLTYTIAIHNAGSSDAQSVQLTDVLPTSVRSAVFSLDGGDSWQAWTGSMTFENLQAGTSREVIIQSTVEPGTSKLFKNTARVAPATPDPVAENNTASVTTHIQDSGLSLSMKDNPDPVVAGTELTYTIQVSNGGPSIATMVTISDTIPVEVDFLYASPGCTFDPQFNQVLCSIGTMAIADTETVQIVVSPQQDGDITNSARVSSAVEDPYLADNKAVVITTVQPGADLAVESRTSSQEIIPGEMFVYRIKISNSGPSIAEQVILSGNLFLSDELDQLLTINGVQGEGWDCAFSKSTFSCSLDGLAPGESAEVRLSIMLDMGVEAGNQLQNELRVSSVTKDPLAENNSLDLNVSVTMLVYLPYSTKVYLEGPVQSP